MPSDSLPPKICPLMSGPSGRGGTSLEDCTGMCAMYDRGGCALLAFIRREPSQPSMPTSPMPTGSADDAPDGMHRLSVHVDGRRVLELDALRIEVKPDFEVKPHLSPYIDLSDFEEVLPKYVITAELPGEIRFREHA